MASIYDKASLVLIPSGTKTSKVFSQKPVNGDGDFTFSRSTAATRVNADGNIEKETQNLLLQSNTFDTTWATALSGSLTGGQSGYDGSSDAWLMTKGAQDYRRIQQAISSSGVQTMSVYAKANTQDVISILCNASGGDSGIVFNLATQTWVTNFNTIDFGYESIGNDWYRVYVTFNKTINNVNIYVGWNDSNAGSIYIQDAQLEQGLVARDYIETTTAAVEGGITDNVPRLDYTDSSCPALLLEPQRTNLVTQSELLKGFFNLQAAAQTENATTSPEGVQNAVKMYPTSTGTYKGYNQSFGSSLSNTAYTLSVYAKAAEFEHMFFYEIGAVGGTHGVWFNLSTGNVGTTEAAWSNAKMTDMGNGWYRCEATLTYQGSADYWYVLAANADGSRTATASGTNGLYLYGAQMEEASYATSYIPTYGTSVTRNFDKCIDAGDNAVIDSTQGTIYGEQKSLETDFSYNYFSAVSDGTNNNRLEIRQSGTGLQFLWRVGGTYQGNILLSSAPFSSTIKYALRYSSTDIKLYVNGSLVGTINSPTLYSAGTLNNLQFADGSGGNNFRGVVNNCMYFPTALTDQELIDLTT